MGEFKKFLRGSEVYKCVMLKIMRFYEIRNSYNFFQINRYRISIDHASKYADKKSCLTGISSGFVQFWVFAYIGLAGIYGTWLYQNGIILEIGYVFTVISAIGTGAFLLTTIQAQLISLKSAIFTYKHLHYPQKPVSLKR